ncbi:MAG TPA: hypothetical protein VEC57_10085 [Candidatus Limnocylindrales bacterium]|nr:hypothetical protein [Candidatus Limnocylindrales bacterium]
MPKPFADFIYTGTVRYFYKEEVARQFMADCEARGYETQLVELPGEDLHWRVTVIGKKGTRIAV